MTPGFPPPPPSGDRPRSTAATVIGWILVALGALVALGSVVGGDGFSGRIAGLLLAAAIAVVGAMLVWRFTSWKIAGPGAALALVLSMLVMPSTPKEPTPASGLVGPTSVATVTSSATKTVTVTETTTTAPSSTPTSTAPSTTTTAVTTTTTVAAPPNPGVTETNTRTPVPTVGLPTTTRGGGSAYYPNCDAARAAGVAPIPTGAPGYRSGLDRNNDGVACE